MSLEAIFQISLILTTFLCSLVGGFLFAFAIVVMPGIKKLNDGEFIRAFQVMDGVIQNNQPLFIIVWIGSVLTLVALAVFGFWQLDGVERLLISFAALAYVLGVHLPTITINIPSNNKLQTHDVDALNATMQKKIRKEFESRWNQWNSIRTAIASVVSVLLMVLLFYL